MTLPLEQETSAELVDQMKAAAERFARIQREFNRNLKKLADGDWHGANSPEVREQRLDELSSVGSFAESMASEVEVAERIIGTDDLQDLGNDPVLLENGRAVGRVVIGPNGSSGFGTGFLVGAGLMLTNHHVLPNATEAARSKLQLNYKGDNQKAVEFALQPERLFINNKHLDFALVAVSPAGSRGVALSDFGQVTLATQAGSISALEPVPIIQHPEGGPQRVALKDNKVIVINSPFIWYRTDTQPGSSGSPVFNRNMVVVGLHHSGVPQRDSQRRILTRDRTVWNRSMGEDAVDWIANEGILIVSILEFLKTQKLEGGARNLMSQFLTHSTNGSGVVAAKPETVAVQAPTPAAPGQLTYTIQVPLTITVSLGAVAGLPVPAEAPTASPHAVAEKATGRVWPKIDRNDPKIYRDRDGYNEGFLAVDVPMPDFGFHRKKLSQTAAGEVVLHYTHFSLVHHKQRRMCLLTAENLHGGQYRELDRKLDRFPNATNVRRAGADFWYFDPRLPKKEQLGTEEGLYDGNLDLGHMVHRSSNCWGRNDEQAVLGNDDTFYFTNCVPQHKNVNRKTWEKLEGAIRQHLLDTGRRGTVFTGPILSRHDRTLNGIQIPEAFWKIAVVDDGEGSIKASGWIRSHAKELDHDHIGDEALVESRTFRVPIEDIENQTGIRFGLEKFEIEIELDESTSEMGKLYTGGPVF